MQYCVGTLRGLMDYKHLYTGDHKNTIFSFDFKVINTIFEF